MRPLTNKQVAVLEFMREQTEPLTAQQIAEAIMARTPCSHCDGTGDGSDSRFGCRPCYGRGRRPFYYPEAYTALQRLRKDGLVTRRFKRDEWGDEIPRHVYEVVAEGQAADDPLESLWRMPAKDEQS